MEELIAWAGMRGLTRLELTVISHNKRAVGLCPKMGFEIEGLRRRSLFIQGKYIDEFYMSRLLFPA